MKTKQLIALGTILLTSFTIAATELEVPATPYEIPSLPTPQGDMLALDLDSAYAIALKRNLDLQVGRIGLSRSDAAIYTETGVFDLNIGASLDATFTKSPAATDLEGADITESDSNTIGLRLDQLLPTGTQWTVRTGTQRNETNSQFYFINPRWGTDITAELTQPLLRNFGTLVNRSGIVIARNSRDQNAVTFEMTVVDTLRTVEDAYWSFIQAREGVGVAEQSTALAERLLGETQERVKVGTSAPIDLVQSEAELAARTQDLIVARNSAANAEDTLKAVLGFDSPTEWLIPINATEEFRVPPTKATLAEAIEVALGDRPELRRQDLAIEVSMLREKLARNAILPSLDLQATYGFSGIGGDIHVEGETIPGGAGDAWNQIRDREFPHWTIGVQFGIPIGNHAAKGRLAQRRYEKQQTEVQMRLLQQQIIREVRVAVRYLDDSVASINAAVSARELAQRNLEAEQTKFANGLSTNYQVLLIQRDLANAQLSEIASRIAYLKALAGYRFSTGTLLDHKQIAIKDPGQPDIPNDYWKDVKWLQFSDFKGSSYESDGTMGGE
ncbi:MAG: TolC family protein [bacterium]|nr:TolC family protein [bacterium]